MSVVSLSSHSISNSSAASTDGKREKQDNDNASAALYVTPVQAAVDDPIHAAPTDEVHMHTYLTFMSLWQKSDIKVTHRGMKFDSEDLLLEYITKYEKKTGWKYMRS